MTLRRKMVSLTLCLLLLFAVSAAASLLLQSKISEQFSGVVDDYLPLNTAVATIDVFTDRYELDLARLTVVRVGRETRSRLITYPVVTANASRAPDLVPPVSAVSPLALSASRRQRSPRP